MAKLDWEGCSNARDLGGLPAAGGRRTRERALVRSDSVARLTAPGWRSLARYGIRTIIDLRNDEEIGQDAAPRPSAVATVRVPLDVSEDREFWDAWRNGPQFGTPLYYRPHLERHPERNAAVLAAIAEAPPGGVLFHCAGGRDRSGQVAMLVLALVGVSAAEIAADYALSVGDDTPMLQAFLAERGTSAERLIVELLSGLDVERHLLDHGLERRHVRALRERLLG